NKTMPMKHILLIEDTVPMIGIYLVNAFILSYTEHNHIYRKANVSSTASTNWLITSVDWAAVQHRRSRALLTGTAGYTTAFARKPRSNSLFDRANAFSF